MKPSSCTCWSFLFAYLFLVAQYESWSIPLAVILSVVFAAAGALAALWIAHIDDNICAQIGLVLLVGLAAKNAILIVEFAKKRHDAGLRTMPRSPVPKNGSAQC